MNKQELQHKICFEVFNDKPKITIGLKFKDLFTTDTYVLASENVKYFNKNNIPFSFIINNEKKGTINLVNLQGIKFLSESFNGIEDYDFQSLFTNEIKQQISEEITGLISDFEKQLLLHEVSLTGEVNRMKELSGLKRKFLS